MKKQLSNGDFAQINKPKQRAALSGSCIVLLPSYEQVLSYRKSASLKSAGLILFGTHVTTFRLLIEDWWGLYGDGRAFVSSVVRRAFLASVEPDAAVAEVAAALISRAMGTSELRDVLTETYANTDTDIDADIETYAETDIDAKTKTKAKAKAANTLSAEEQSVLTCVARYLAKIRAAGYVELGEALELLPDLLPKTPCTVKWCNSQPLEAAQEQFFAACPWIGFECEGKRELGPAPLPDGVQLRFAFPSGAYAWPRMLAELCTAFSSTVGVCKRPLDTYEQVARALEQQGVSCAVRDSKAFAQTSFGLAYFAVSSFIAGLSLADGQDAPCFGGADEASFLDEGSQSIEADGLIVPAWGRYTLADFLLSPFSGMNTSYAYALDAQLRSDRAISRAAVAADLRANSQMYSYFEELCSDAGAGVLCGALEDVVRKMSRVSEAWKSEQLCAISCLRDVLDACACAGVGVDVALTLLQSAQVQVTKTTAQEGTAPDVRLLSLENACGLAPRSCAAVVCADLTSTDYPVALKEDAATTLLEKLDIHVRDTPLRKQRRAFASLETLPAQCFVAARPLNDATAEPTYPAAVLEELIDCYRKDPSLTEDIDNEYALPEQLQEGMLLGGEENLYANAQACEAAPRAKAQVSKPRVGEVSASCKPLIVLPRVLKGGTVEHEPSLSPSQIESYLECPYKWFAQRRLRLDDIDEGFGPLEMGDFAHNCLCSFYRHFIDESGYAKVTQESLPLAREIMCDVLSRHAAYQTKLKTRESRLIPTTQLELRELQELQSKLMKYLDFEAKLLPSFRPEYLEYDVADGATATYAGCKIVGTADRVDVDDKGHFVIIDYKGSLSSNYALGVRTPMYLGKVQALIYAQVIRRSLGLTPAAALYVSYGRRQMTTGAYDASYCDAAHLPYVNTRTCSWPLALKGAQGSFEDLLDQTEEQIARALEGLFAGNVKPCPHTDDACTWCPVTSCPERRA